MNSLKILNVFIILLGFALTLGILLGLVFKIPYGNIAVIKVDGVISNSKSFLSGGAYAQDIIDNIHKANDNPLVKTVIFDINSGGGSSVASQSIVRAIKGLNKPSVALIRDVGASGAYWVASACDYIVASDLSLVGSIGVTMNYLEFSGLLDKYNVSYVNLSYPEHKDIFSQYRPLTPTERGWANEWLKHAYDVFVSDVASNRNMSKQDLLPYANGSVFLGYQALNYSLIDAIGGWPEVYNKSIELGNVTEPVLIKYEDSASLMDLVKSLTGEKSIKLNT